MAHRAHAVISRVVGNQSAKGIAIGALGLTGVKTVMRLVGAPNWLGRFEQPVETLATGLALHTAGLGSADLLTAGVKETVSEGIGVLVGYVTGGASYGGGGGMKAGGESI